MALVRPVFLDTSVLLGGLLELGQPGRGAQALFDAIAARRLGRPRTAWHCCLEFYAVSTRLPEEFRLLPEQAVELLEKEVFVRLDVFDLPANARMAFLSSAAAERVAGGRLYDAHIARVARLARSAVIVTENVRHFQAVSGGLRVLTSAEAVHELRPARKSL